MHLLKERKGQVVTTKCLATLKGSADATIWWTDVTCPDCLTLMNLTPRRRRRYKKVPA